MKTFKILSFVLVLSWLGGLSCPGKEPNQPDGNPFVYEVCNGLDDDGDDQIDENDGGGVLRRDCSTLCGTGQEECIEGRWVFCDAPVPLPESCNGFDDNCNGVPDEDCDCVHRDTEDCAPEGAGPGCPGGLITCHAGVWSECVLFDDLDSLEELCGDEKDNDCDGDVDEDCDCAPKVTRECGEEEGECHKGTQTCGDDGQWGACEGDQGPEAEICDGLDNDCDGHTDASESYSWTVDLLEGNNLCGHGYPIGTVSGNNELVVLVSGSANGPPQNFPTMYPKTDIDWYKGRVRCPASPANQSLRFTFQLIDALQEDLENIHPNFLDYRLCVNFGDLCASLTEDAEECTRGTNWYSGTSQFTLDVSLAGRCDSNEEVNFYIRVDSPTTLGCGHYDLRVRFAPTN